MTRPVEKAEGGALWPYALGFLLVVVVLAAGNSGLRRGDVMPKWDGTTFYAPSHILLAEHIRQGEFDLWNPWVAGGRPDAADPQVGAFSPVNLALGAVFGAHRAGYLRSWLFIWCVGALGVFLLGRGLGAPAWGCTVAALAFVSSGLYVTNAEHFSMLVAFSLLPWVLWRFDAALGAPSGWPWAALQAGALWGLSGLSGYPAIVIMTPFLLGFWAVGRVLFTPLEMQGALLERARRALVCLALVGLLGTVVLLPAYLTFAVEGGGYTDRSETLDRSFAIGSNALHPGALTTIATPFLAEARLVVPGLWPYTDPSMVSVYFGTIGLLLAALALARNVAWRWWLFGIALLFLASALGRALPVRGWMYDYLFVTRYFRHPAVLRCFFLFLMVVLILYVVRDLHRGRTPGRGMLVMVGGALLGAVVLLGSQATLVASEAVRPAAVHYGVMAVLGGLCVWLISNQQRRPTWAAAGKALLLLLVAADALVTFSAGRVFIYTDRVGVWLQAERQVVPSLALETLTRQASSPFGGGYNNLNQLSKTPTFRSVDPMQTKSYRVWSRSDALTGFTTGEDRFWFTDSPIQADDSEGSLQAFLRAVEQAGAPHVLLHIPAASAPSELAPGEPIPGEPIPAEAIPAERVPATALELVEYRGSHLEFVYEAPRAGWLWVTDRFAPGWKATVNGSPSEIGKANFLFRAIRVQPGRNHVQMKYRPAFYPWLQILSWALLGSILTGSIWRWRRVRRLRAQAKA